MVDITLSRDTKIWIEGVHGKVGSNQKWSDTYVSGTGNSVSSSTVERGEFWVVREDGTQSQIEKNFAVAPGHEVTVLWGNAKGMSSGPYFVCRNYTANTTEYNETSGILKVIFNIYAAKELKIKKQSFIALCVSFSMLFFVNAIRSPAIFLLDVIVFVTSLVMTIRYHYAIKRLPKPFVAELRAAIQKLLDDPAYIKSIS